MRTFLMALTFTVLGLMISAHPSKADVAYPWCAQYASPGSSNCGFSTYEQCRAALSGNGGYCEQNPMYRPGIGSAPASLRPRR